MWATVASYEVVDQIVLGGFCIPTKPALAASGLTHPNRPRNIYLPHRSRSDLGVTLGTTLGTTLSVTPWVLPWVLPWGNHDYY